MNQTLRRLMRVEQIERSRDEVDKENRIAISLLAKAGLAVSIVNFFVQLVVAGRSMPLMRSTLLMGYFVLLLFADRVIIPRECKHTTALIYLLQAPILLLSTMLGTIWDPTHQATTFMLFLIAMPAFVLDRADRMLGILAGWSALFLALCRFAKTPELFRVDAFHILEFYLTAAAMGTIVLRVRLESLNNLEQAVQHMNYDRQTGAFSRYALASRTERYIGKPMFVVMGDLDQMELYVDFYGREVSDAMIGFFARVLTDRFGAEDVYRYGGDELLCVAAGSTKDECLEKLEACREALRAFKYQDKSIPLTSVFGYVTGTPGSADDFLNMIRLADIHAHKAKRTGHDQTLGSPFDEERLRAGVVESNLITHARAYEINPMTDLPGMSYFIARADQMLAQVADLSRRPVVGHFKLMQLRNFNSAFGYAQGDALIGETARLLREAFAGRHVCYITAGSFGVLCYREEVETALEQVNRALRSYRQGFPVYSKAGFAEYTGSESAISLMDQAKTAEKSIRKDKDISFCYYDDALDQEVQFQQYLINHVDEAIREDWLKVYYQPIARTVTGLVCDEEALSRWDDPKYGFLTPDRFVPQLEEAALMYKVNLNVVRLVLADFRRRQELGVPIVPVSVNLSRRDFEQCDMVREISEMVDASGFSRDLIKIEITESAFIHNQELLKREVARFRSSGFAVWLDDFGSEYSTLNLLEEMDFDLIKIDMRFMKNFSGTGKNFIIISEIVDMVRHMGVTTLIEGVETIRQYQMMQRLGCEKVQGYLFNRPNPLEYIADRARSGTGLLFEDREVAGYYEAVGRVDLNEPMTGNDDDPLSDNAIPAGVLERREDGFALLRGTDSFQNLLEDCGALAPREEGVRFRHLNAPLPEGLLAAADRSAQTDEWITASVSTDARGLLTVYLRRVSVNQRDGVTAILAVVLRGQYE